MYVYTKEIIILTNIFYMRWLHFSAFISRKPIKWPKLLTKLLGWWDFYWCINKRIDKTYKLNLNTYSIDIQKDDLCLYLQLFVNLLRRKVKERVTMRNMSVFNIWLTRKCHVFTVSTIYCTSLMELILSSYFQEIMKDK